MNQKHPKISVITPSYNQCKYIESTIESVLSPNYPNLEYIIIDGGSTDGSVDIIRNYQDKLAYWVSETDQGQTDALNKGFARATGDIFCWLCSDDLLESWTLWEVANYFQNNPEVSCVYGDTTWIDAENRLICKRKELPFNRFIFLYEHNFIPQPSTFWRRDLHEEIGLLNPEFEVSMDADLWLRFSEKTTLHHVSRPWSCMRLYSEQKTQRLKSRADEERRILCQKYFGKESDVMFMTKRLYAKTFRLGWKLAAGCYL